MIRQNEKTLMVCTVPALISYSVGVINAALNHTGLDCYAYIFISGKEGEIDEKILASLGLPLEKKARIGVNMLAANKVVRNLATLKYLNQVKRFAEIHQITKIHFISQDVILCGHLSMFNNFKLYYTVHDLTPHPAKLSAFQRLKHYYFRIRKDELLTRAVENLVTNSIHQKKALEQLYPKKRIFWHSMPSLVVPAVKNGDKRIEELKDVDQYVLFFGRIELYKGIEVLYQAFTDLPILANLNLVIAGKGEIYFKREKEDKEGNITFLNRYIADEEMACLFKKALCVVLPYHSATQTAVTSLGYYFGVPTIAHAIDGLNDTVIHEKTGLLYEVNKPEVLANAIIRLQTDEGLTQQIKNYMATALPFFKAETLGKELTNIYL
ncbi:glycosyltransferase [Pedobacter frigiditerrae]|uniref:glycosyltransferase family 4 protein n=1 Tax=Pedobacter frigiditerrae TaxID=2530452 RepID=UPI00292E4852|nr:glycosyltransferase [Pedobacter frigiditerrae]